MLVTPPGIVMLIRLRQNVNAPQPIFTTLSGIVMLVRFSQLWNAPFLMHVTPSGMTASVTPGSSRYLLKTPSLISNGMMFSFLSHPESAVIHLTSDTLQSESPALPLSEYHLCSYAHGSFTVHIPFPCAQSHCSLRPHLISSSMIL